MAPEKRLNSADRKRLIIEAALPLFASRGVEGTTTKQIAQAADVSEALLYKYFPSKESIYEQMLDFLCTQVQSAAEQLVKMPKNTNSMVHVIYATLYFIYIGAESPEEKKMKTRLLSFSLLEDGKLIRSLLEKRFKIWIPHIVASMEAARDAGDMHEDDTPYDVKVWIIHHLAVGFSNMDMQENLVEYGCDEKGVLEHMARFALRGVGLKESAIDTYFNPEALYHFSVGIINQAIEKEKEYETSDDNSNDSKFCLRKLGRDSGGKGREDR